MDSKSVHDKERDYIATNWLNMESPSCDMCRVEMTFPNKHCLVRTEFVYSGRLRADLAFWDVTSESLLGVIEVIDTSPPSATVIAVQETLPFAYYRLLSPRTSAKRRIFEEDWGRGQFTYSDATPKWLCSTDCLAAYNLLEGANPFNEWEPPRCYLCDGYFHANHLSQEQFLDWENPYDSLCIHCAASISYDGVTQWRSPGELAGGDPREWIPTDGADVSTKFLAYCDAAFWSMVWAQRVEKLGTADTYYGERNPQAEDATVTRLSLVHAAFDSDQWEVGAKLLSPIGAPSWADYPGETERMLAFRPENCMGVAVSWERLKAHRIEGLPHELSRRIPYQDRTIPDPKRYLDYLKQQRQEKEEQLRQEEAARQGLIEEERERRQIRFEQENSRWGELQRRYDEAIRRQGGNPISHK